MIDLHTHSNFSDGTDTPAEIIDKALQLNLSAIALTDHNTLAGVPEFLDAAKNKDIIAVPGIEISTDYNGTELHMVGLFVPESAYVELNRMLQEVKDGKRKNTKDMVEKLAQAGYDITFEEVESKAAGSINRNQVADVLVKKGYVASRNEAFDSILSENGGFYTPGPRLNVFDTIAKMRKLGIVPVLAHSFLNLNEEQLREFLPQAVASGLQAMEVFYGTYNPETMALAQSIADEFHLAYSGGSDYHGSRKDNRLGSGTNGMAVPDEWYNTLYQLAKSNQT